MVSLQKGDPQEVARDEEMNERLKKHEHFTLVIDVVKSDTFALSVEAVQVYNEDCHFSNGNVPIEQVNGSRSAACGQWNGPNENCVRNLLRLATSRNVKWC